jgi:hypothetical protein
MAAAVIGTTPYEQTIEIPPKLEHELGRAGAGMSSGVQTRRLRDRYLARGRGRPRARAGVRRRTAADDDGRGQPLIDPRMLVEIETVAVEERRAGQGVLVCGAQIPS